MNMDYYFSKTVEGTFEQVIERVREALKGEGFGVLTDIDVQQTLRKKLDVPFKKYRILGACNPLFAHRALLTEDKIGTMLPCNVVVQEDGPNSIQVAAIDPVASMQAVDNMVLKDLAGQVKQKLRRVVDKV